MLYEIHMYLYEIFFSENIWRKGDESLTTYMCPAVAVMGFCGSGVISSPFYINTADKIHFNVLLIKTFPHHLKFMGTPLVPGTNYIVVFSQKTLLCSFVIHAIIML